MSDDTLMALRDLYYAYAIPLSPEMKRDAMEDAKTIIDKETAHERRNKAKEGGRDITDEKRK